LKKQLAAKEEVLKSISAKQEQLLIVIDGLTQTVESLNWTVQLVSTCKIQAVTAIKWSNVFPAINRVKSYTNYCGLLTLFCLQLQGLGWKYSYAAYVQYFPCKFYTPHN
jgi:hypothetical protein